jgi:cytochrome d ubiquinol oxidase subunit II
MNTVSDDAILGRTRRHLLINAIPFLAFFLAYVTTLVLSKGFAADPATGIVSLESYKYLHNLLQMPLVLILFLLGIVLVLGGILLPLIIRSRIFTKGIWLTGTGTVFTVFALFLLAGFNNTSFYPSTFDLQSSLTIQNSSSSHYTLTAMSYVSLLVPFVLAYIWYAWRSMNRKKIDAAEMESETHTY